MQFCISFVQLNKNRYPQPMSHKLHIPGSLPAFMMLQPLHHPTSNLILEGYFGTTLSAENTDLFSAAFIPIHAGYGGFSLSDVPPITDALFKDKIDLKACAISVTAKDDRFTTPVQQTTAYIIARADDLEKAIDYTRKEYAGEHPEYNRPPIVTYHSLKEDKSFSPGGWIEPREQFMFFHDKAMFEKSCQCFGISEFQDRTKPTTTIEQVSVAKHASPDGHTR